MSFKSLLAFWLGGAGGSAAEDDGLVVAADPCSVRSLVSRLVVVSLRCRLDAYSLPSRPTIKTIECCNG